MIDPAADRSKWLVGHKIDPYSPIYSLPYALSYGLANPLIMLMNASRYGIWLIGARGGVATSAMVGLAALRRGLTRENGLVSSFFKSPLGTDNQAFFEQTGQLVAWAQGRRE